MAKNYKYTDKKMVKGKWVYYYDTKPTGTAKKSSSVNNRLSRQFKNEYNQGKQEFITNYSANKLREVKKERNIKQEENNAKKHNQYAVSDERKKARQKQADLKLQKYIDDNVEENKKNPTWENTINVVKSTKKKQQIKKQRKKRALAENILYETKKEATANQNTTDAYVRENRKNPTYENVNNVIKSVKRQKQLNKAVDKAVKEYEKTFPKRIEKGKTTVFDILNGTAKKKKKKKSKK